MNWRGRREEGEGRAEGEGGGREKEECGICVTLNQEE